MEKYDKNYEKLIGKSYNMAGGGERGMYSSSPSLFSWENIFSAPCPILCLIGNFLSHSRSLQDR